MATIRDILLAKFQAMSDELANHSNTVKRPTPTQQRHFRNLAVRCQKQNKVNRTLDWMARQ